MSENTPNVSATDISSPRVKKDALGRGYYIVGSRGSSYYLYDDGQWRVTVKSESASAFWRTRESAEAFLSASINSKQFQRENRYLVIKRLSLIHI